MPANDDINIRVGVDSPGAEAKLAALCAEIEKTGKAIDKSNVGIASMGNQLNSQLQAAESHVGALVKGLFGVEAAFKAVDSAAKAVNETMEHGRKLGEQSRQEFDRTAPARQQNQLGGKERFGEDFEPTVNRINLAGVDKGEAYKMVGTAADMSDKLSKDQLQSALQASAELAALKWTNDPTRQTNAIAKTMLATGAHSAREALGITSQFGDDADEHAALGDLFSVASANNVDPLMAGVLFKKFQGTGADAATAADMTQTLLKREHFKTKVASGSHFNPATGERDTTMVDITGDNPFDRLQSIAKAYQGATPEQQEAILKGLGARGSGIVQAALQQMMGDQNLGQSLWAEHSQTKPVVMAGPLGDRMMKGLRDTFGREVESGSKAKAAGQAANLAEDNKRIVEDLRARMAAYVEHSGASESGVMGAAYYKDSMMTLQDKSLFSGIPLMGGMNDIARAAMGRRFAQQPLTATQEILENVKPYAQDTTENQNLIAAVNELVQKIAQLIDEGKMKASPAERDLAKTLNRLDRTLDKNANAPVGPRSGEVR